MSKDMGAQDIERLRIIYRKTDGQAWEPPNRKHPWLQRMVSAGFLRPCAMRCGFEAFDTGINWTDAGRLLMDDTAQPPSGASHD